MLTLLAIICPSLAVLITGTRVGAVENLGLTLLGYFPGVFNALSEVERYTTVRQYDAVMRVLERA
jgi:uncharacterized membrane protein YqaE (UPF0057 family)